LSDVNLPKHRVIHRVNALKCVGTLLSIALQSRVKGYGYGDNYMVMVMVMVKGYGDGYG